MEKARSRRNPFPTVFLVLLPPFPPCLLLFIASNDSVTRHKPWWSHYNKAAVSLLLHMNGHFCTGPVRLVYQPGSSSYEFHIQIYVAFYKSLPISSSGRVKLNSYVNFKSGHPWQMIIRGFKAGNKLQTEGTLRQQTNNWGWFESFHFYLSIDTNQPLHSSPFTNDMTVLAHSSQVNCTILS